MSLVRLTPEERRQLQTIAEGARDRRVLRRVLVLLELDAGERPAHLARRFKVCRATIYNWAARLRLDGPLAASFEDRPRPGRPPSASRPPRPADPTGGA